MVSEYSQKKNIAVSYVLVKQSDLYPASHFRSGLFFTAITIMALYFIPINWEDPIWMLYFEVGAFFLGYVLAYHRKVKRFFTFRSEMKEEVYQLALETMANYGLLGKSHYIFLFASKVEKRLECLYSPEIEEFIPAKEIDHIISSLKGDLKNKKYKETLDQAVRTFIERLPKSEAVESLPEKQALIESQTPTDLEDGNKENQTDSQIGVE